MNSNELLDALKKHTGVPSDYALARDVLHIEQNSLKAFRERGLPEERAFQIATIMGLDPGPILASIRAERAKDPKVRKAWEGIAKSLKSAAAGLLAVVGAYIVMRLGTDADALPYSAQVVDFNSLIIFPLYIMSNYWLAVQALLTILCGYMGLYLLFSRGLGSRFNLKQELKSAQDLL